MQKKAPGLTVPQVSRLLAGILPQRRFDTAWVLEVVAYRQQRNHAAYRAHRKHRIALLDQVA